MIVTATTGQQHYENFVGLWLVDQPMHALYEATLYDLKSNGRIQVVESFPKDWSTGTVGLPPSPECNSPDCARITCRFGDHWHSQSPELLVIAATCSDAKDRDIVMHVDFIGPYAAVDIVSVGGEPGWDHLDWSWMWRKCASREDCTLARWLKLPR